MTTLANIALIKYWGKRDEEGFLPTKSSISISMPELKTTTSINVSKQDNDIITLNETLLTLKKSKNIIDFLNFFRKKYNIDAHYIIKSQNSFPTAAGLASSSSGFAALAKELNKLHNLQLSPRELSILARHGSGSACRSIQNGFVIWHKGERADGTDSYAEQLFDEKHWPELKIIVVIVDEKEKKVSSRVGMQQTVDTSPFYREWIIRSEKRIQPMIDAIREKNVVALGELAEQDCLEMHHCMQTTTPTLNYLQPKTKNIMQRVKALRESGIPCYFTIDAGPNVKIITLAEYAGKIMQNCV